HRQFGIYGTDRADHQVFGNTLSGNVAGDLKIQGTLLPGNRVFYVDAAIGNEANTVDQAQNPATPWRTIRNAVNTAQASDTVLVKAGVYPESVESKRDGTVTLP